MPCRIEIPQIILKTRIGCSEEERSTEQPIHIGIRAEAGELFPAVESDRLEDTLDAAAIVDVVKDVVAKTTTQQSINTLEKLGGTLEVSIREKFALAGRPRGFSHRVSWELKITKPKFGWSYVQTWQQ